MPSDDVIYDDGEYKRKCPYCERYRPDDAFVGSYCEQCAHAIVRYFAVLIDSAFSRDELEIIDTAIEGETLDSVINRIWEEEPWQ